MYIALLIFRYDCVLSQFLSSAETYIDWGMRYWMINKCHPGFTDNAIIDQCAQHSNELDSIVPVTDPVTNTHYRNKYCALCNKVDDDIHLISWKFLIYNTREFVGSVSEENLLKLIRETMGNIVFQPPAYIKVQTCYVPPYSISTCNETGLWPEYMYDENIENACHSFLDPFNLTYKNYFCFLCNTAENVSPKNGDCVKEPLEIRRPVGLEDLVNVKNDTDGALDCGSLQFEDDKMVSQSGSLQLLLLLLCCCLTSTVNGKVISGRSFNLPTLFLGIRKPPKRLTSTKYTSFHQ